MAIIRQFPIRQTIRPRAKKTQDGFKYFGALAIKLIRRTARDAAQLAHNKGQSRAIREWMLLDLLTSSGLRESEAADLRCGDIHAGYGESSIFCEAWQGG